MSSDDLRPPRFSLLRAFSAADFITLANAACGTASIFLCLHWLDTDQPDGLLWGAFLLLPLAFIFDAMDGIVARKLKKNSPYGGDLDSLADTISFGVAPAVLGFSLGLRGAWDAIVLVGFVCCGISRLARFNVTADDLSFGGEKVKYFEGTPIPTSLVIVAMLMVAWRMGAIGDGIWGGSLQVGPARFHPFVMVYAISGWMMISARLRIPKP